MAKKRDAAKKSEMKAEEVYAELATQAAVETPEPEEPAVDSEEALKARIAELEAQLLARPDARTKTPLDPEDKRLDERVLPSETVRPKHKTMDAVPVHTYRELGVHPDDLDEGMKVNPKTGGIVRCRFIKKTSGNLIEMP